MREEAEMTADRGPDEIRLKIDGRPLRVAPGTSVAAAIVAAGHLGMRRSPTGERRAAFCAMGVCFECCVTIDGRAGCRSCQVLCREAMDVRTGEGEAP
jgi:D-hydroxyproline dehydrogenase subunit gamma